MNQRGVPQQLRCPPGMKPKLQTQAKGEGMAQAIVGQVLRHVEAPQLLGEPLAWGSGHQEPLRQAMCLPTVLEAHCSPWASWKEVRQAPA